MIQTAPVHAGAFAFGAFGGGPGAAVKGAPYSATITNESVQTLADGTHITQSSSGSTARDSQGRTRQDAPLPAIGNLSATDAPHLVFVQDPVAGTSYTLNLTDKTAWKNPCRASARWRPRSQRRGHGRDSPPTHSLCIPVSGHPGRTSSTPAAADVRAEASGRGGGRRHHRKSRLANHGRRAGDGRRAPRETIAVGKIGNDRPICIITEVWTSPELKTIVLSKRNDPRMGEQTFKLTNIQRGEPDPSLFAVPSDFKVTEERRQDHRLSDEAVGPGPGQCWSLTWARFMLYQLIFRRHVPLLKVHV